jgi:AcrR family transcriptional regulator
MARPSPAKKPRNSYHHGNLRRALLDETLATIRAGGVESLTLREIGARLGVSRTALYRHFADKSALLDAVATEGFRALREQLVAAWQGPGGGPAGFDAMGVAYVRFAVDNSAHYRVMFGGFVEPEARRPELLDESAQALDALVRALTELQRDGLVRGDDPMMMAVFVWSVVHGVARLAIDGQLRGKDADPACDPAGGQVRIDALARYAVERLRSGIAVAPERWAAAR